MLPHCCEGRRGPRRAPTRAQRPPALCGGSPGNTEAPTPADAAPAASVSRCPGASCTQDCPVPRWGKPCPGQLTAEMHSRAWAGTRPGKCPLAPRSVQGQGSRFPREPPHHHRAPGFQSAIPGSFLRAAPCPARAARGAPPTHPRARTHTGWGLAALPAGRTPKPGSLRRRGSTAGEPGSRNRDSKKKGGQGLRGGGRGPGGRGLRGRRSRGVGAPTWGRPRGGGVPGIGGPEVEGSRRPGGAVPPAEPASLPAGEPRASEDENFSSSGKEARQGARLTEGRSSAERRGGPTMFPGPRALPRARGSGGREARGRPGRTRTDAALPAPPQAASPLPPTLQQVAAAPRARVPFLAPGPAPAGGHQYPS